LGLSFVRSWVGCVHGRGAFESCKNLSYLIFDPSGLRQTYRDQATGAELPVLAVFNLEGSSELRADIEMDRRPVFDASLNLANHLPFGKAQEFLEGVNQKSLRTLSILDSSGRR
jgi:hypothetical protein